MLLSYLQHQAAPKLPILLADEMPNAKARAMEYCYRPRELMLKGYNQVRCPHRS
jgi:hypothetical protein